jgi:lipoprotein-anchoring transpeptidase ErfK/SrfK
MYYYNIAMVTRNNKKCKNKSHKNKTKKQFLYNPDDPKKSFDVYIDKNPKDTIHIKYTTTKDVKNTIRKLEKLYKQKKYSHKRIWQVGMIMKVRLEVLKNKKPEQYKLSKKYFEFLGKRTRADDNKRYKMVFIF